MTALADADDATVEDAPLFDDAPLLDDAPPRDDAPPPDDAPPGAAPPDAAPPPDDAPLPAPPASPTITSADPSMSCPSPPQCLLGSLMRKAGFPLMKTVAEPFCAFHMLGPQQTA
jgi:hypothetical protein